MPAKRREETAGVVERVHLRDFMCHEEFTWRPGPRVNFLSGSNGAGKSSVVAALALGLLGEARATRRYSRLQDFVRRGAMRAVIQVTLTNR